MFFSNSYSNFEKWYEIVKQLFIDNIKQNRKPENTYKFDNYFEENDDDAE